MPDDAGTTRRDTGTGTSPAAVAGDGCASCGSPHARRWSTPDGPASLCPACATLHGLGCP